MQREVYKVIDPQMKRGLLEVCVLSVLCRGDSYGYQIIKDIEGCLEVSESTLYPILRRLETADCLAVYSVEHNSRLRKFYQITARGRGKIDEFLAGWQEVIAIINFIKEGRSYEPA